MLFLKQHHLCNMYWRNTHPNNAPQNPLYSHGCMGFKTPKKSVFADYVAVNLLILFSVPLDC